MMNHLPQQQLQSYQREYNGIGTPTTKSDVNIRNDDDSDCNGTRVRQEKNPLSHLQLPFKLQRYFSNSMLGVFSIVVTVCMILFVVVTVITTPRIRQTTIQPLFTASHTTTIHHASCSFVSCNETDDLNTKTFIENKHHRIHMIRQQLLYIHERIDGTVYFPPCTSQSDDTDAQQLVYDSVATGWVKQRPILPYTHSSIRRRSSRDKNHHADREIVHGWDHHINCHNLHNNSKTIGIVIIQVQNEHDVQIVVPVLAYLDQTYNFPFRIRSGGHHKAGYSSLTDLRNSNNDANVGGAVLSLSLLNHLRLVPLSLQETNEITAAVAKQDLFTSVVIGPAVKVQDILQQVTLPYKYGGVIGFCSNVAEGGFVLGGGFGVQSRLYGLGLDSAIAFRIVLYNGTVVTTTSRHNSDLHWALLGAGSGSYGVVTEMEYKILPVSDMLDIFQLRFHDVSTLAYFLYKIGKIESTLPDNLVLMYDGINAVSLWWTGRSDADVQEGNVILHRLVESIMASNSTEKHFDTDQMSISWTGTFGSINSTEQTDGDSNNNDWGAATWAAACWTGFLFPENNTVDIWNDIMHHMDLGLMYSQPYLLPDVELWGGDISRRTSNASAFPYRSAIYNVGILLMIPLNEPNGTEVFERESKKVNEWWHNVDQYLTGSYVNYPTVSLLDHDNPHHYAKVLWGENLPRLVRIKQQYDPNNVFRFPMSVPDSL